MDVRREIERAASKAAADVPAEYDLARRMVPRCAPVMVRATWSAPEQDPNHNHKRCSEEASRRICTGSAPATGSLPRDIGHIYEVACDIKHRAARVPRLRPMEEMRQKGSRAPKPPCRETPGPPSTARIARSTHLGKVKHPSRLPDCQHPASGAVAAGN